MSTRISSALIPILALAACGSPDRSGDDVVSVARQAVDATDDSRVPCARGGAELRRACTVEQVRDADGLVLTIRHPDGGFRRLRVTGDGRGVVAADGAEAATVRVIGPAAIEVAVAGDRYRLPATVKRPS